MSEEKLCPNCNEPIEDGAIYCGNCGFKLLTQAPYSNGQNNFVPTYSKTKIYHRKHWPSYSVIFGLVGVASSLIIPIVGLIVGILAIILSTSSINNKSNKKYRIAGLVIGIIAIIIAITFIVISVSHNNSLNKKDTQTILNNATVYVTTPCYEIKFSTLFNFSNRKKNSCNLIAYYGPKLSQASQIYNIEATYNSAVNSNNLDNFAQNAISQDIATNLKGFRELSNNSTIFEGSRAYYITAYNPNTDNSIIEEMVYHPSLNTNYNIYIIVRSEISKSTNLNSLESAFIWQ